MVSVFLNKSKFQSILDFYKKAFFEWLLCSFSDIFGLTFFDFNLISAELEIHCMRRADFESFIGPQSGICFPLSSHEARFCTLGFLIESNLMKFNLFLIPNNTVFPQSTFQELFYQKLAPHSKNQCYAGICVYL